MAKFITQNVIVKVNGVDLSDHAFNVSTPQERDRVDVSGFNSTGAKEFLPGASDATATVQFLQDYASGKVHQTINPLYQNSSTFSLQIWPNGSVTSSTNPVYQGTASLFTYTGLDGNLGDRSEITVEFASADALAPLAWATA